MRGWMLAGALFGAGMALQACNGGDDVGLDGDTDTDTDTDTDVETDCEDGADDDADGAIDCEDTDCSDVFVCTWPTAMAHQMHVDFAGNTIECKFGGFPIDIDVDDCITYMRADLVETSTQACPSCDRTFEGPWVVESDSCSELLGTENNAVTARYGVVFDAPDARTLWAQDAEGAWAETGALTRGSGRWAFTTSTEVREDIADCNNGVQFLGVLDVELAFTDTE